MMKTKTPTQIKEVKNTNLNTEFSFLTRDCPQITTTSTGICHKTINYPPQIQNNKPIHYLHNPIGANYPTQI